MGQVERCLLTGGHQTRSSGGDKVVVAPQDNNTARTRQVVYIGHTSSNKPGSEVLPCHISKLRNAFGITPDMIDEA